MRYLNLKNTNSLKAGPSSFLLSSTGAQLKHGLCLVWVLFMVLFSSCSSDEVITPADVLRSVSVKPQDENVLRMTMTLNFKSSVTYQIEYWPENKRDEAKITDPVVAELQSEYSLIFLKPQTTYEFCIHMMTGHDKVTSEVYSFTTSFLPGRVAGLNIQENNETEFMPGYLMYMDNKEPGMIVITDMDGQVVWYQQFKENVKYTFFDKKTQTISCILGRNKKQPFAGSIIRIIDLKGNVLFEKVDEELMAHHEICRLDNGDLLMVHFVQREFDLTSRGGSAKEKVTGDGLVIMDSKTGEIKWNWDCFMDENPADDPHIMDKLDILNLNLRDDWLHVNSAACDSNGDFYISLNWSSEIWKISGKDRKVVYKIGNSNSIQLAPKDQMQGVHCVSVTRPDEILAFDNGRVSHISRALTFSVNPQNATAQVSHQIDLMPEFGSPFQGSIQKTADNLYVFGATQSDAILIYTMKGELLRIYKTPFQTYRTTFIDMVKF